MKKITEIAFRMKIRKALNDEPIEMVIITREECEKIIQKKKGEQRSNKYAK